MIVIDIPSLLTTPIKLSSPWHCNFCFEKIFRQVYKFSAEQLGLLLNRADSTCIHNSSSTVPFLDFQGNLLLLHRIGNMEYFVLANICFCKVVYHTKGLEFYKYSVQYLVGWTKGMYANFARSLWSINTEIAGNCGFTDHFPIFLIMKNRVPQKKSNEPITKTYYTKKVCFQNLLPSLSMRRCTIQSL